MIKQDGVRRTTELDHTMQRDGHADIFGDAHRCVCRIYVGYSAILSDNAEADADIRICKAIPISHIWDVYFIHNCI